MPSQGVKAARGVSEVTSVLLWLPSTGFSHPIALPEVKDITLQRLTTRELGGPGGLQAALGGQSCLVDCVSSGWWCWMTPPQSECS